MYLGCLIIDKGLSLILATCIELYIVTLPAYSGNIGAVELPLERSFGVDTYEDLNLIKKIMRGS